MRLVVVALFVAAFCGCASVYKFGPISSDEYIKYESHPPPFCGACDSTTIYVAYDGRVWIEQGWWEGDYRSWRTKRRQHMISADAVVAFRNILNSYRPEGDLFLRDAALCVSWSFDQGEIWMEWHDATSHDRLVVDESCVVSQWPDIQADLENAPTLLGIPNLKITGFDK